MSTYILHTNNYRVSHEMKAVAQQQSVRLAIARAFEGFQRPPILIEVFPVFSVTPGKCRDLQTRSWPTGLSHR